MSKMKDIQIENVTLTIRVGTPKDKLEKTGCGDEKPSKYCCEESVCNYGYSCVENGIGDCMCERDYSNKYLEAEK